MKLCCLDSTNALPEAAGISQVRAWLTSRARGSEDAPYLPPHRALPPARGRSSTRSTPGHLRALPSSPARLVSARRWWRPASLHQWHVHPDLQYLGFLRSTLLHPAGSRRAVKQDRANPRGSGSQAVRMASGKHREAQHQLLPTSHSAGLGRRKPPRPQAEGINEQNPLTRPQSSVLCSGPQQGTGLSPKTPHARPQQSTELPGREATFGKASPPSPASIQPCLGTPVTSFRAAPLVPPRASSSPPTYLGADVQHQCLRLVLLHLAAAPVGQREGAGLSWGSQGLEEGERRGARARQPKQRGAAPALALHPLRNSENTHRYQGRASSGTNRRNKHKKNTQLQRVFLQDVYSC